MGERKLYRAVVEAVQEYGFLCRSDVDMEETLDAFERVLDTLDRLREYNTREVALAENAERDTAYFLPGHKR